MGKYIKQAVAAISLSIMIMGAQGAPLLAAAEQSAEELAKKIQNPVANLIQPFLNCNFSGGIYLSSAPIITANWKADSGDRWTVPLGGGAGKIVRFGRLPVNFQ